VLYVVTYHEVAFRGPNQGFPSPPSFDATTSLEGVGVSSETLGTNDHPTHSGLVRQEHRLEVDRTLWIPRVGSWSTMFNGFGNLLIEVFGRLSGHFSRHVLLDELLSELA